MDQERRYRIGGGRSPFGGLVVVAVGVIFLLNNLDIIDAGSVFRVWFWPLLLIGFGLSQLLRRRDN